MLKRGETGKKERSRIPSSSRQYWTTKQRRLCETYQFLYQYYCYYCYFIFILFFLRLFVCFFRSIYINLSDIRCLYKVRGEKRREKKTFIKTNQISELCLWWRPTAYKETGSAYLKFRYCFICSFWFSFGIRSHLVLGSSWTIRSQAQK